jgi:hypothetical protein
MFLSSHKDGFGILKKEKETIYSSWSAAKNNSPIDTGEPDDEPTPESEETKDSFKTLIKGFNIDTDFNGDYKRNAATGAPGVSLIELGAFFYPG